MPMDFPDMSSLEEAADIHGFRKPNKDESEEQYRAALANHVAPRDRIEAHEIRTGKGWDLWTEEENRDLIRRGPPPAYRSHKQ